MKNFLNQLGTIGIVTLGTLMVWLYAEDANIKEYTDQSVQVKFVIPTGIDGVTNPSETVSLQVDFKGSNGQYQQFIDLMREGVIKVDMPLTFEKDLETVELDTRALLEERVPQLRNLGINITAVRPTTITLKFDRYVDVPIALAPIKIDGLDLAKQPEVVNNIRQVTVRVLASRRDELEGVQARIDLTKDKLANKEKGKKLQIKDVGIRLPESLANLTPTPARVDLFVELANYRDTVYFEKGRPILINAPPTALQKYTLTIDKQQLSKFTLEGPRETIQKIKNDLDTDSVWATVRLTNQQLGEAADSESKQLSVWVEVVAPEGVELVSDRERVTITVERRPDTEKKTTIP